MTDAELTTALRTIARLVAREVVAELRDGTEQWVDQHTSPFTARRHCAAVRRRIASGAGGAAIVGRRHLLTREALEQELAGPSKKVTQTKSTERDTTADDFEVQLARKLRLVGGKL